MGLEPKLGSMVPAGESDQDGVEALARRIVALPKEEYLPLLHDMYRKQYELNKHRAPRVFPPVSDVGARRVEPENGKPAG